MHDATRAVDGSSHFRDRWGCIPVPVILEGKGSGLEQDSIPLDAILSATFERGGGYQGWG